MEKEIWKDVKGSESMQVSSKGRLRDAATNDIIKTSLDTKGYPIVNLKINGVNKLCRVHSLVTESFLGERPSGYDVNHKIGDKQNVSIDNLEYTTRSDNISHAYRTGLNPYTHTIRIIETGEEFNSISDCARAIGGDQENVRQCLYDKYPRKTCCGYHFEFVDKCEPVRAPKKIRIKETGEIFDSARECERVVGGAHRNITLAVENGKPYNGLHFEFVDDLKSMKKQETTKSFLYDYQMEAVQKLKNGNILVGSVGSGKSRSGLFYYFKENGGWIDENGYVPMKNPQDLYIITTAKKRDSLEWDRELAHYLMSTNPEHNQYKNKIVVDSWNNIQKYKDVTGSFFLYDEQRIVGTGAWVKTFLKLAKTNNWILLTATPADTYLDLLPVFLANGYFKNKTEFNREHVVFARYAKYPKIERFINTTRLDRLKSKVIVQMDYKHKIDVYKEDVYCSYDIPMYKDTMRKRWDPYRNAPIEQASGLCYVLRRIVNSDESRQVKLLELLEDIPRAIIFYNFDYEREILLNLGYGDDVEVAEWTGHAHQPVPDSEKWVYICQYNSAAEGWENTQTNVVIFYSQNYSYKIMTQAAGRVDRLNTPFKELRYYYFKSRSGIDLAISRSLGEKKKFNETTWVKW